MPAAAVPPAPAPAPEVARVLDEAPICHVGFLSGGRPIVLPALHARVGGVLYLHGAPDGALMRAATSGAPLSINAVVLDGIAVARSACRSALNYRSALLAGKGRAVADPAEKEAALRALTERVTPGGWERGRAPRPGAVADTTVAAIDIVEATLRSRTGPPQDEAGDLDLACWAGVVPLRLEPGPGIAAPGVASGLPVPPVLGGGPPAP